VSNRRWHYVYYSYEEYGRGYIGKRSSKLPPDQDPYLGSFTDKTFKPTKKIIIATFSSSEEAMRAEIALHRLFKVDKSAHFANKVIHPSPRFCRIAKSGKKPCVIRPMKVNKRRALLAAKLLELESRFTQADYDELAFQLKLIDENNKLLISQGREEEVMIITLLKDPGGIVIPVTNLSHFCAMCKLNEQKIKLVLNGQLNHWNNWTRAE